MHSVIRHSKNIKIHEFCSDICEGLCWAGPGPGSGPGAGSEARAGPGAGAGAEARAGAVWFQKTEAPRPSRGLSMYNLSTEYYARN